MTPIEQRTEEIRKEAHEFIDFAYKEAIDKGISFSYQDIMSIWIYTKMAQLELQIEELKNKLGDCV